jgi:hypothetical protein
MKEMVSKMKRLPTEWEKIFASCTLRFYVIPVRIATIKKNNNKCF